jgi:hypothetical protein
LSSTLRIQTPRAFVPLLDLARSEGEWGGRDSGKSHFFAELLIVRCLIAPTRWLIGSLGVGSFFDVQREESGRPVRA